MSNSDIYFKNKENFPFNNKYINFNIKNNDWRYFKEKNDKYRQIITDGTGPYVIRHTSTGTTDDTEVKEKAAELDILKQEFAHLKTLCDEVKKSIAKQKLQLKKLQEEEEELKRNTLKKPISGRKLSLE